MSFKLATIPGFLKQRMWIITIVTILRTFFFFLSRLKPICLTTLCQTSKQRWCRKSLTRRLYKDFPTQYWFTLWWHLHLMSLYYSSTWYRRRRINWRSWWELWAHQMLRTGCLGSLPMLWSCSLPCLSWMPSPFLGEYLVGVITL